MASLVVRNVDESLVQILRERAASNGRSAEAEHREILASVLRAPRRKTFAEVLLSMPDVGEDADFTRIEEGGATRVFD